MVKMEHPYDLHDKFKRLTNYKTNSSTMQYEMINIGFEQDPKNVNLGLGFCPIERATFIKLFKQDKDIFARIDDDLEMYDIKIIHRFVSSQWSRM